MVTIGGQLVTIQQLRERASELHQLIDNGRARESDLRSQADAYRDSWLRAEGALMETEGWMQRLSTPPPPPPPEQDETEDKAGSKDE